VRGWRHGKDRRLGDVRHGSVALEEQSHAGDRNRDHAGRQRGSRRLSRDGIFHERGRQPLLLAKETENISIDGGGKAPITIDALYNNPAPHQDLIPEYRGITLRQVRVEGGGRITLQGNDDHHRTAVTLDGVLLDQPAAYRFMAEHARSSVDRDRSTST
jgi:hypothetical protein